MYFSGWFEPVAKIFRSFWHRKSNYEAEENNQSRTTVPQKKKQKSVSEHKKIKSNPVLISVYTVCLFVLRLISYSCCDNLNFPVRSTGFILSDQI